MICTYTPVLMALFQKVKPVWILLKRDSEKERYTHTHTHLTAPCQGLPGVSRYQKGKTNLDFTEETVSGSGISWAICKSAPRSRQMTIPATHRSVFYRPDAFPAAQPTASKH